MSFPSRTLVSFVLIWVVCVLGSCRRERRTFGVQPAEARTTAAERTTASATGGGREGGGGEAVTELPPDDFESAYSISQGRLLYQAMNCAGCHGAHGGGGIGPALSDDEWKYGWEPDMIFDCIVHGRGSGMPSFGGRMSGDQVWKVVGYVRSLSGLGPSQALPGRDDAMAGPAPNTIERRRPRRSTRELEELRDRERQEFARWGWIDPRTGEMRIPGRIVEAVERQSRPPATTPASTRPVAGATSNLIIRK